ncbi:MAG: hypothetical protein MUE73_13525 [Planctomycetes bacterium]|jgi:hypothetical protein|nr:hypothetical protein [Planctomycetota bacterium]
MDNTDDRILFVLEYVETSRDSNWSRTSVSLSGRSLSIRRETGGPFPPEDETRARVIDGTQVRELLDHLRENGFATNLEHRGVTGGTGLAGRLDVTIRGASTSRFHAEDMLEVPGREGDFHEQRERFRRAEAFVRLAHRLADAGRP